MTRLARYALLVLLAMPGVAAGDGVAAGEGFTEGKLLVAAPSMADPRFRGTVIYMCEHDRQGALGLILNRRIGLVPAAEVAEQFELDVPAGETEVAVHWGGPVEPGRGFVLHSDDYASEATRRVATGIAYSFDIETLTAVIAGEGPARALVMVGYAGWGAQQLESELARDDWRVVPADAEFVFETAPESMWQAALDRFGIEL